MRKVIHKVWWAWDFDKEEAWLNEMAAKGLALVSVGFCRYEFEDCRPGEYSVRLQLLKDNVRHPESEKYLSFLEETGAEHIGSWIRWVYLRRKTDEGSFELFSDLDSRCRQLSMIITFILSISAMNVGIGIYNISLMFLHRLPISALGFFNLALGILGCIGCRRLSRKRRRLREDAQIFEA